MEKIKDYLPESEILAQLAEEASELSQAALKLRRAEGGINPTPTDIGTAMTHLLEEIADVYNCVEALELTAENECIISSIMNDKRKRWVNRLKSKLIKVKYRKMRLIKYKKGRSDNHGRKRN